MDFWKQIFSFHSPDIQRYLDDLLQMAGALLSGRTTYEGFAQVWPTREGKMAETINALPKYVASRTLKEPLAWNASLIQGDVVRAIEKLKHEPGKPLVQYGVGELTRTMLKHGLVDELIILVFPFVFGEGLRIFEPTDLQTLKLLDAKTFDAGVVALRYQPGAAAS